MVVHIALLIVRYHTAAHLATPFARSVRFRTPIGRSATVLALQRSPQPPPAFGPRFNSTVPPSTVPLSRWRRFLQTLGRVTLVTLLSTGGLFYYVSYKDRTPGPQEPFDPEKKTIVVLGSGWGATSLLKSLDNEDYNVVRIPPRSSFAAS